MDVTNCVATYAPPLEKMWRRVPEGFEIEAAEDEESDPLDFASS